MKCSEGYYYDSVVELCSPCVDICDPGRHIMVLCRTHCPGAGIFSVISNFFSNCLNSLVSERTPGTRSPVTEYFLETTSIALNES